jgi:hypothetical protein
MTSKALAILENACDLPKGKSLETHGMNSTLVVKLHGSGKSWVMWIKRPADLSPLHTRWADNKADLLEDLEYFVASDALPINQNARW